MSLERRQIKTFQLCSLFQLISWCARHLAPLSLVSLTLNLCFDVGTTGRQLSSRVKKVFWFQSTETQRELETAIYVLGKYNIFPRTLYCFAPRENQYLWKTSTFSKAILWSLFVCCFNACKAKVQPKCIKFKIVKWVDIFLFYLVPIVCVLHLYFAGGTFVWV